MTSFQDCSIGFVAEVTPKTYVAPTRWIEFTKESLDWTKNVKQGAGLRVGARVARSGRRVVVSAQGKGDIECEVASKGLGLMWQNAMGTSVSTLVSAATYQQNHTLGDVLPSITVQKGLPRVDGTVDAYSFLGCTVDSFDITSPGEDIVTAKFGLDISDVSTSQGYVTPSYPAAPVDLVHWGQGVMQLGGTITAATTTTLATMASPIVTSVSDFSLSVNNNTNTKRFTYGNSGRKSRQIVGGYRAITGKFTGEYDQVTIRDAFLNDTDMSLLLTFTGAALGIGNVTFQICAPVARVESDLPNANGGDLISVNHAFTVLDGLVQAPITISTRTADIAL